MSALQVEFTQNLVGISSFSQRFLATLFRLVGEASLVFSKKVLRSNPEPENPGVVASSGSSAAPLKFDMVHISQYLSNHENQRFESFQTENLSDPTSSLSRPLEPIHINERQPDAGRSANAKAVATRERNGAMRGVSHVGHRIEFTRSTAGSHPAGSCAARSGSAGRVTACRRTSGEKAPNRGFDASAKSTFPSRFSSSHSR